jgi:hypothetical protein
MAYFSNGSEGTVFDEQCSKCKYGNGPCPIALVQIDNNYDQFKDTSGTASKILNTLVDDSGKCFVWEMAKQDFEIDPNQLDLFDNG